MDSWKYASHGKNQLSSEEMDLIVDGVGRTRNKVIGWEIKPLPQPDGYPLISNTEALASLGVMELGFPDLIKKSSSKDPSGDGFSDELGADSCENLQLPTCTTSNGAWGREEFGQKIASYVMESNSDESPPIDLKLGWLADCKGAKDSELSKDSKAVSSFVHPQTTKRLRSGCLYSLTPFCQVHGCNKDLSSSKDYHKRHKVCDAHSKTAKVIVNGIEQRFCQQCSRFHLLAEFDDGKRSCRKRLANHNQRRRKPQLGLQSGTRFLGSSLLKRASFLFPNVLTGAILSPHKHEPGRLLSYIRFEDPTTSSNFFNVSSVGERMVSVSTGTRDNMIGIVAPAIHDVASATNSSCALSLLSNQSQTMSKNVFETTMGHPKMTKSCSIDVNSSQSLGFSLGCVEHFLPNLLCSTEVNPLKVDKVGSASMICSGDNAVNLKAPIIGTLMASDFVNPKCRLSSGDDPMVDLLQLSSHLERVEQQKSSAQPTLENNVFCAFPHFHGE